MATRLYKHTLVVGVTNKLTLGNHTHVITAHKTESQDV